METCEECLREAAECDRLGALAQTPGARILMLVASRQWRQLAQKATERRKTRAQMIADPAAAGSA